MTRPILALACAAIAASAALAQDALVPVALTPDDLEWDTEPATTAPTSPAATQPPACTSIGRAFRRGSGTNRTTIPTIGWSRSSPVRCMSPTARKSTRRPCARFLPADCGRSLRAWLTTCGPRTAPWSSRSSAKARPERRRSIRSQPPGEPRHPLPADETEIGLHSISTRDRGAAFQPSRSRSHDCQRSSGQFDD